MSHKIFHKTGSHKLYSFKGIILLFVVLTAASYLFSIGVIGSYIVVATLIAVVIILMIVKQPKIGLNIALVMSFLISGISRITNLPVGLSIDILMALIWIIMTLKSYGGLDWKPMKNTLTYCLGAWFVYCALQLLNPFATSFLAWFYAVRGLALYSIAIVPLLFLLLNKKSDLKNFITIWFLFSITLGLYGAKQFLVGVFHFEQVWLDTTGHVTHVLWGKFTRMFSFLSDANQFGSSQAHVATVAIILAIGEKKIFRKILYILTSFVCFYGMFISGTRGAIIVPIVGLGCYLLLSKNFKILSIGSAVGASLLYLLIFTHVLHGVEPVRRMRTAFSAQEDESFNVRLENRKNLALFMSDKPFGGGIGSAGVWGQRFSPNNFLSNFETDGHYVRIHAETGIIGLSLYYILYGFIILKMVLISWKLKNPKLKNIITAFTCGIISVMIVNYGAAVIIGLPTSLLTMWCMAFVFMSPKWDKKEDIQKQQKNEPSLS
jgi:hypothetical protein